MSEYWSGSITFTGLGSGTDFDSIIEATMEVESYRLTRMEAWEEQWTAKLEQVQEISSELSVYKTQLETMDTMSEFLVKSASATDSSVLSVSADSDAIEATHTIEVGQKAQNDIWSSTSGWDNEDTVITDTDASFAVEINGEILELEVSAGTTLEGFVNLINNSTEMGSDIRANLIDDGDEQHLQIRSLDLGEDYAITIQDLGEDGITGLTPDDFEQTQVAQNAKIKVDGYPSGDDEWIERDSNTFSDVIDGLTFTILDTGETEVNVVTDTDAIIENIESFIEKTNSIRDAIAALDEDTSSTSVSTSTDDDDDEDTSFDQVRGNYGMDIIEQTLQDILSSRGIGFELYDSESGTGDVYASLVSIGISTDADEDSETFGHLIIDYDELEEALAEDPDAVARIFAAENDGVSYDTSVSYDSSIDGVTEAGEYEVEYTVVDGELTSATIDGVEAGIDGWTITSTSGNSSGLAVTANIHSDGTYTGTIYLRQGKINETLDALDTFTSSENGTLQIIEDSYQEIIDNNAEAIEREEARLETKEQYLIERYAELESLLGYYEDLSDSLETQIDNLE